MQNWLNMELDALLTAADAKRRQLGLHTVERCAIFSAKSGKCSENCAYCAQSAYHTSICPEYALKPAAEIVAAAQQAYQSGAQRFGIVTAGNAINDNELNIICEAVTRIASTLPLKVCASLGALHVKQIVCLKAAGLSRYHHNIETAPSHYPAIVTTHSFQDRLDTIARVKAAGLELCCGGIIGMGETWAQRLEFAHVIDKLDPDSLPLNFLMPIPGTRIFGTVAPLATEEALRVIALLRLVVKRAAIRLCSGRELVLQGHQAEAFSAGASGMMIGGYLTLTNHNLCKDFELIQKVEQDWQG